MKKDSVKQALSTELAIKETKKLLAKFEKKELENITDENVLNDYGFIVEKLENGQLTFDEEMNPSYKLSKPIVNDKEEVIHDVLKLKTRIKPTAQASLIDSVGSKNHGTLMLVYSSHIVGFASSSYFDKISVPDYNFLTSICLLFINGGF